MYSIPIDRWLDRLPAGKLEQTNEQLRTHQTAVADHKSQHQFYDLPQFAKPVNLSAV